MFGKLSAYKQQFLYYTQPLKKGKFAACDYSFETNPFCHTSAKKDRKYSRIPVIAKFSSVHKNLYVPQTSDPLEESTLLSSRTQFAKIKKVKKNIAENQCEKHTKNWIAAEFAG